MEDGLERLISSVFKIWKEKQKLKGGCLDEDTFAAFLEHKLSEAEELRCKGHIISCEVCAETLAAHIRAGEPQNAELPRELARSTEELLRRQASSVGLELFVRAKNKVLELVNTNADVLVGMELVPAALLRSRNIRDFKDEVVVLKDFQDFVVQIRLQAKEPRQFDVLVLIRNKQTQKPAEALRVTLIREAVELESSVCEEGKASFENIGPGAYSVEITGVTDLVAAIRIDIQV